MNIEQIEKQWQARANSMTLDQVEDMLVRLPTQPKTGVELVARAVCMERRITLINASRPDPQAPPPDPVGLIEVIVPAGAECCVQSRTLRNKFYYGELRGERHIIKMPWHEFVGIANATVTNGAAGANGACWWECNPHLVAHLPKNDPPPAPAPYQEQH
jgi:hypothetical protein